MENQYEKKMRRISLQGIWSWSRKRKILAAVIVIAVLFFLFRCGGGKSAETFAAGVMPLEKTSIQEVLSVSGPVEGTDSVDVVSNIHAEITELNVKEGDKVRKGQVLAVLDRTELDVRSEIAANDANVWKGFSRFIAGFNDWRFTAIGGVTGGDTL